MSVAEPGAAHQAGIAISRPTGLPTRALAHAVLWLIVFLGGFVFVEPAPYDLLFAVAAPLWMIIGLTVPRSVSPLVLLLLLFMAGGILAGTQATDLDAQPIYYAITGFLALSACFFACLIAEDRSRLDLIVSAWIAAAVATTCLGLAGYFGLTGGMFVRYGRATGGFQDPNVFGPFLVFPFLVLVRRVLTGSARSAVVNGSLALVILAGIFLSFSRASWGLALLGTILVGGLLFVIERNSLMRARLLGLAAIGAVAAAIMLAAVLSVPAVADLFAERAQIVQEYDSGYMGRFQRHAAGLNMMLDRPLGIGALEFGLMFGQDEHDIWLKALTTYGWLGFASFLTLVLWTLAAAFPLLFKTSPLQAATQVAYVVFLGHIVIATIIDVDHWRHLFLLIGLLWGAIGANKIAAQRRMAELTRAGVSPAGAT